MVAAVPVVPTLPERFVGAKLLGAGSQAVTVAARDERTGHEVAIKVLELSRVRDWSAFERFDRECAVLESLDHPGVPRVVTHIRDDERGRYLLVMERVPGRSLAEDLAEGRRRTEAGLLDLLEQLLDVLEYLHGLHPPVIHRDIKPGNVIVRPDGRAVLVDFGGVAKVFRPRGASTVVGTFGYMAPEQLYGQATPGTDLYALGATIAALAAGEDAERLPRRGLEVDLREAIHPGRLCTVLEAMLRADPNDRPRTVAEVRAWLRPEPPPRRGLDEGADPRPLPAVASPSSAARTSSGGLPSLWRRLGPRERIIAVTYVWVAVGLGVITRAIVLSVGLLLLLPAALAVLHGLRRDDR